VTVIGFSYLVSDFLFHIELICLLERERGLQGCKPRSLFWENDFYTITHLG